jgi:hypothetical protein
MPSAVTALLSSLDRMLANDGVTAVSRNDAHTFSKSNEPVIQLVAGVGVDGDVHAGATVKHRSRTRRDATRPNLRQVHLMHAELHDELAEAGFTVEAGDLGENVTTRGIDLLSLPVATRLQLGDRAVVELTGLRNPCRQIDEFQPGLLKKVLERNDEGAVVYRVGVMGGVVNDGAVRPGDEIHVILPPQPHQALELV